MAINKQQALEIARRTLDQAIGPKMVIQEDVIEEREFGWVFHSASAEFLKTRDPNKSIPGVGPLVVNKDDGSTEFISTSGPPDVGIQIYEQKWRDRHSAG